MHLTVRTLCEGTTETAGRQDFLKREEYTFRVEDKARQGAQSVSCMDCGHGGAPSHFSQNVPRSEPTKKGLSKE